MDPRDPVYQVFLKACKIHPLEVPIPESETNGAPKGPSRPPIHDQFMPARPTPGQRALEIFWRI